MRNVDLVSRVSQAFQKGTLSAHGCNQNRTTFMGIGSSTSFCHKDRGFAIESAVGYQSGTLQLARLMIMEKSAIFKSRAHLYIEPHPHSDRTVARGNRLYKNVIIAAITFSWWRRYCVCAVVGMMVAMVLLWTAARNSGSRPYLTFCPRSYGAIAIHLPLAR